MISTEDTESQISLTVLEYDKLLQLMDESTQKILSAIKSENAGRLARLVKSRRELCRGLVLYNTRLKNMLNLAQSQKSLDVSRINGIHNRLQADKKRLLTKQAECESALSASLHRCRVKLNNLNRHQNLRNTYQRTADPQQSRFIDNRL
ncbi:MAG: hypothetical protein ABFD64_09120 [Armatimonadota bacterium]